MNRLSLLAFAAITLVTSNAFAQLAQPNDCDCIECQQQRATEASQSSTIQLRTTQPQATTYGIQTESTETSSRRQLGTALRVTQTADTGSFEAFLSENQNSQQTLVLRTPLSSENGSTLRTDWQSWISQWTSRFGKDELLRFTNSLPQDFARKQTPAQTFDTAQTPATQLPATETIQLESETTKVPAFPVQDTAGELSLQSSPAPSPAATSAFEQQGVQLADVEPYALQLSEAPFGSLDGSEVFADIDSRPNLGVLLEPTVTPTKSPAEATLAATPESLLATPATANATSFTTTTAAATRVGNQNGTAATDRVHRKAAAAWAYLPLLLLPLFGFLLWGMFSKRNSEQEETTFAEDNASRQKPSHHSQSRGFVRATTVDRSTSNESSTQRGTEEFELACSTRETTTAASQATETISFVETETRNVQTEDASTIIPLNARVARRKSKPDFEGIDVDCDSTGSPVEFLYGSDIEISNKGQCQQGISALCEIEENNSGLRTRTESNFEVDDTSDASPTPSTQQTETAASWDDSTPSESIVADASTSTSQTRSSQNGDDLTKIHGIGPASARLLRESGIISFRSLREASTKRLETILANGGSQFQSIDPRRWSEQARFASSGDWTGLSNWQSIHCVSSDDSTSRDRSPVQPADRSQTADATRDRSLARNDLTKIRGLGKASQRVLNDNEVYSFAQVASMTSEQLDELFASMQRRFQLIDTSTWPAQAREFAATRSDQEAAELDTELGMLEEINSLRAVAASASTSSSTPRKTKQASKSK